MKLPAILVSDLHLTSNPADEYRWGLFPWLVNELAEEKAKSLVILGDLTDAKDYHSAELVNRVVRVFQLLRKAHPGLDMFLLRGNHDYLKDGHMFFEFLEALGVHVITRPSESPTSLGGELAYFLPYSKTPAQDWKGLDFSHYRYLFMHQTVKGAIASNGQQMDGESLPPLNAAKVYSGDIHVPQIIHGVEYVGSPYHVHFGDAFKPRAVALDRKGEAWDLRYPSPRRLMIDVDAEGLEMRRLDLDSNDQVKLRVHLDESEKHQWQALRRLAVEVVAESGAELCGLELKVQKSERRLEGRPAKVGMTPADALYRFVDRHELGGDLYDIGMEVIEHE